MCFLLMISSRMSTSSGGVLSRFVPHMWQRMEFSSTSSPQL